MKLSTKTRYAVRAVFDIAYHGDGKATQARDIARRQEVPLRYLEQIFQELKRAKLVEGKRGPNGGYSLARGPESITLGDIVRAVQGPIEVLIDDSPVETDGGGRAHASPDRQVAATIWKEIAQRVSACFDEVNIRQLCARAERLGIHRGDAARDMYFI